MCECAIPMWIHVLNDHDESRVLCRCKYVWWTVWTPYNQEGCCHVRRGSVPSTINWFVDLFDLPERELRVQVVNDCPFPCLLVSQIEAVRRGMKSKEERVRARSGHERLEVEDPEPADVSPVLRP